MATIGHAQNRGWREKKRLEENGLGAEEGGQSPAEYPAR